MSDVTRTQVGRAPASAGASSRQRLPGQDKDIGTGAPGPAEGHRTAAA